MSRARLAYDRHADVASRPGIDPDTPIAGFYRMRLRSGGIAVAVCLWHGEPIEPWTGEAMDRGPRWCATINGKWAEVADVWPRCAGDPIDKAEALHLMSLQRWGEANGHAAIANPRQRIDLTTAPLPF